MPALTDQVQVDLAERRQVAVRVVDGVDGEAGGLVAVRHLEPVVAHRLTGQHGLPHAAEDVLRLGAVVSRDDRHGLGIGPQGANDEVAGDRMGAEHAVRVVVCPADQRVEDLARRSEGDGRGSAVGRRGGRLDGLDRVDRLDRLGGHGLDGHRQVLGRLDAETGGQRGVRDRHVRSSGRGDQVPRGRRTWARGRAPSARSGGVVGRVGRCGRRKPGISAPARRCRQPAGPRDARWPPAGW